MRADRDHFAEIGTPDHMKEADCPASPAILPVTAKLSCAPRLEIGMGKDRLAAFSDGVIAIIITIMVLELKVPHGMALADLGTVAPHLASYVLSFIYIGIYWNNHHHLLHTVDRVDGLILWANS